MNNTIAAVSTTLGVGAISIIRVSGNNAIEIVNKLFDGEHQAYTTNVVDELKGLVLKYDPTSTDYSLKMSGMDSDGSSIEFTLILGATKNRPTHVQLPEEQGQGAPLRQV